MLEEANIAIKKLCDSCDDSVRKEESWRENHFLREYISNHEQNAGGNKWWKSFMVKVSDGK